MILPHFGPLTFRLHDGRKLELLISMDFAFLEASMTRETILSFVTLNESKQPKASPIIVGKYELTNDKIWEIEIFENFGKDRPTNPGRSV